MKIRVRIRFFTPEKANQWRRHLFSLLVGAPDWYYSKALCGGCRESILYYELSYRGDLCFPMPRVHKCVMQLGETLLSHLGLGIRLSLLAFFDHKVSASNAKLTPDI